MLTQENPAFPPPRKDPRFVSYLLTKTGLVDLQSTLSFSNTLGQKTKLLLISEPLGFQNYGKYLQKETMCR